jgi:YHS domain-containing protein
MAEELKLQDCINSTCPWSGRAVNSNVLMFYRGKTIGFCNPECRDMFLKASSKLDELIDASK